MRRAARTDATQTAIANAFRSYGCAVAFTHMVGNDFPDLVCSLQLRTWLVECKNGKFAPSKRKLTEGQLEFRKAWKGMLFTVDDPDQVGDVIDKVLNSTVVHRNPMTNHGS